MMANKGIVQQEGGIGEKETPEVNDCSLIAMIYFGLWNHRWEGVSSWLSSRASNMRTLDVKMKDDVVFWSVFVIRTKNSWLNCPRLRLWIQWRQLKEKTTKGIDAKSNDFARSAGAHLPVIKYSSIVGSICIYRSDDLSIQFENITMLNESFLGISGIDL